MIIYVKEIGFASSFEAWFFLQIELVVIEVYFHKWDPLDKTWYKLKSWFYGDIYIHDNEVPQIFGSPLYHCFYSLQPHAELHRTPSPQHLYHVCNLPM